MKQFKMDPASVPSVLHTLYAPIYEELEQVEQLLRKELTSEHTFVDRLARHGFRLGGKRMRPALVLLSGKACGTLRQEHRILAAAMEMIHTATLIHDDVLDEATLRRHLDTVNARWDNEASVLLGDYLLSRSMCLISSFDDAFACRTIAEATRAICEGELLQVQNRGNYDLSEEEYVRIVSGKTATLTACCCHLGAHYAGADAETCEAMTSFGRYVGVAFQIADDLLDILGDEQTAGKSLGTDLMKQKATLPLIRLLGQVSPEERSELDSILTREGNHRTEALQPWFERSGAISYARETAMRFTRLAAEQLDRLAPSPARKAMQGLADFVIDRKQ